MDVVRLLRLEIREFREKVAPILVPFLYGPDYYGYVHKRISIGASCQRNILVRVVDESLYLWRFLEIHAAACFYTNRKEEGAKTYKDLMDAILKHPQYFTPDEVNKINSNAQFFMA
jgi:hypothetical protein